MNNQLFLFCVHPFNKVIQSRLLLDAAPPVAFGGHERGKKARFASKGFLLLTEGDLWHWRDTKAQCHHKDNTGRFKTGSRNISRNL